MKCDKRIEEIGISICGVCNCVLNVKASSKYETCPHPNGDKWLI